MGNGASASGAGRGRHTDLHGHQLLAGSIPYRTATDEPSAGEYAGITLVPRRDTAGGGSRAQRVGGRTEPDTAFAGIDALGGSSSDDAGSGWRDDHGVEHRALPP